MKVIVKESRDHSNMIAWEHENTIKKAFEEFFNTIGFRKDVEILLGANIKGTHHLRGLRYIHPEVDGRVALCRIQVGSNDSNLLVKVYQPKGWEAHDKTWADFVEKSLDKYAAQQEGAVNNQRVLKKIRKLYRHFKGEDFSFSRIDDAIIKMLGYTGRQSCVNSLHRYAKANSHVMQLQKQGMFLFCTWSESFKEEMKFLLFGANKAELSSDCASEDEEVDYSAFEETDARTIDEPTLDAESEEPGFVDTTTLEGTTEDVPASSSLMVLVDQQTATTFQPKPAPVPPPPTSAEEEQILGDILVLEEEIKKLKTLQEELPDRLSEAEANCEETRYELEACREKLAIAEEADRQANEAKSELLRHDQGLQDAIAHKEERLKTLHEDLSLREEESKKRTAEIQHKAEELLSLCEGDKQLFKALLEKMGLLFEK